MNLQALDLMLGQKGTVNPKELSPLALAYIGDAVYEILVRTTVLDRRECAGEPFA